MSVSEFNTSGFRYMRLWLRNVCVCAFVFVCVWVNFQYTSVVFIISVSIISHSAGFSSVLCYCFPDSLAPSSKQFLVTVQTFFLGS